MQVRHEPSSGCASVLVRYSTLPDLMATTHVPQLPARQPASMRMPAASANSRTESPGCQSQVLPDLPKVTLTAGPAVTATGTAAFLTVAGPNASKNTALSGTPHALRSSV